MPGHVPSIPKWTTNSEGEKRFAVSRDEERVDITVVCPGREIELGKARLVYRGGGAQAGWAAQTLRDEINRHR